MSELMINVVGVILNKKNEILFISRKEDPTKFGLIGGKNEKGESNREALEREVYEEANIILRDKENLELLLLHYDPITQHSTYYYLIRPNEWVGDVYCKEGMELRWECYDSNISLDSPFWEECNKDVFKTIIMKGIPLKTVDQHLILDLLFTGE